MAEYRIYGETESGAESVLKLDTGHVKVKQAVRVESALRDGAPPLILEIEDNDLLEVELDDGFMLWTTIDRLESDSKLTPLRDGDNGFFPTQYPTQLEGGERGSTGTAIRMVKVLGYDLPKEGALYAAEKIEKQLKGDGKFFRISSEGYMTREDPLPTAADEATLVLIHGTASSTDGAYAGFFNECHTTWLEIYENYEGRVYGFDHRTLTKSPLHNAIEFLKVIPKGANLHLVAHSRGGLVGDLLGNGNVEGDVFSSEDLVSELSYAFGKNPTLYDEQLQLYQEFNRQIADAAPNITRYVRVGCPAAGTTLASGRLDVYVSILVNLLGQVPGVGPLLAGLGELAAAVAKERTKPEVLPGLEAQMPKSAFIRLLNSSEHELDSDLTVLAGDSDGFFKNLANLFYWRENDLVVDTRSMYGGAPRRQRLWHLEENKYVTHVNYFRRSETAQVVKRGLLRDDSDLSGFNSHRPKGAVRGKIDPVSPSDNVDMTGVILLPGIMGSNLAVVKGTKRDRIWLDKSDLMKGRGKKLAMNSGLKIEPAGVFDSAYEDFSDNLVRHGIHVMPMAYDWRRSLEEAALLLNELIKKRLDISTRPLHLIAHSMGGLVASLLMRRFPVTWQRLRDGGGRLVQAGTPNLGSYVIPRILQGEEKMIRMIAMLDFEHDLKRWTDWVSRFSGILELSPTFGGLDLSQVQNWRNLGVKSEPRANDLRAAAVVWNDLADQTRKLTNEGVLYVAGGPSRTPIYDAGEIKFTERGDGRVTWDSGIPPGAPTWYIPAKHGSLLDFQGAFDGLRELLLEGHTDQLSTERPTTSSALRAPEDDSPPLGEKDEIEYIPSSRDLEAAILDMDEPDDTRGPVTPPVPPCNISVVHGDLRFCKHPVVVGHYRGDQIVHAEDILDRWLNGALLSRHQLKIYPGDIGTSEVLFKRSTGEALRPLSLKGAIVVGLGNVGELNLAGLSRTIEMGLLRYTQACRERSLDTTSLKIAALLVGSGEAGIGIAQGLDAFLSAVKNANYALRKLQLTDGNISDPDNLRPAPLAYISSVEFIELYQDLALEALHTLSALPTTPDFAITPELEKREGGLRRPRLIADASWWSPVQIHSKMEPEGNQRNGAATGTQKLTYTTYGGRARAPVSNIYVQKPLVDQLISDALASRAEAVDQLPATLYELLVPTSLKGAGERRNLTLILDEGAAAYPWELLMDRRTERDGSGNASGIIRQLRIENAPPVNHPEENQILVIGDPPSHMSELKGAQSEAEDVYKLFVKRAGWIAIPQIRHLQKTVNVSSIMGSFMTNDFRILHLAGHGVYQPGETASSGMVVGGSDEEGPLLLTASEVRSKQLKPELVFINCCHLGKIEEAHAFHDLASNLAAEFIHAGVKAVVAAGWPVDDRAARDFSTVFYSEMLAGADFGTAVNAARNRIRFYDSNTWGAYQCYGDPGFRLLMDSGVRSRVEGANFSANDFHDSIELVIEAGNLRSRLKVQNTEEERQGIVDELNALVRLANRSGWLSHVNVLISLGRVYGELRDFEQAIDFYVQASRVEDGGVTLADLEQLANFRSRHGEKTNDVALIKKSTQSLELIISQHGETSERLSLVGAGHKRMVQIHKKRTDVRQSLREMTRAYAAAANLKVDNWHYPATNGLLGVLLLGGPWVNKPRKGTLAADSWQVIPWAQRSEFENTLREVSAVVRGKGFANFWDAVALPDLAVVEALASGDADTKIDKLVAKYMEAIELFGSGREVDSVTNQWRFCKETAGKMGETAKAHSLEKLCAALQS